MITAKTPVNTKLALGGDSPSVPPDQAVRDYLERVAKYVPAEVLALYLTTTQAVGLIRLPALEDKQWFIHLGLFIVCLVSTPLILWFQATRAEPKRLQQSIATLGFVVWAYVVNQHSGVFASVYDGGIGLIAMALFTFVSGFLVPTKGTK